MNQPGIDRRKIVFLEFNELCPELLRCWMAEGRLPNFKRFHDASQVFVAEADTKDSDHLEPWIQWYSLHTGLAYEQHGVFHLSDGPAAGYVDVWTALREAGYRVACCASMNAGGFDAPGSFYLPDPWCGSEAPYPAKLSAYQDVIRTKVQENTNAANASPGRGAYVDFLRFLARHGLRASTVAAVARQLLSERLGGRDTAWRRAALLDRIQFDIFRHYWGRDRYDFATFFLNSTAHYQHAYWHLAFPEAFPFFDETAEGDPRRGAILFGYRQMDRLLGDFFEMERRGAMLVLATALSQQANPKAGSRFYRPHDVDALMARLGVRPARLLPVMAQQYSAHFESAAEAGRARAALECLRYEGQPVLEFAPSPENALFFGNRLRRDVAEDATIEVVGEEPGSVPFYELFYKLPHIKSGAHHPDSVLWFKTGRHAVHQSKASILDVLPTLLEHYGVPIPSGDHQERRGRSLLGAMGRAPRRQEEPGPSLARA